MLDIRVLAISGSLRRESFNRKALGIAKQLAAEFTSGVQEADLKQLALPVYDEDIETQGMPDSVMRLKAAVAAADVLLIASPEYNHSIPGGLKNAIDWLSRGSNSLDGKVAAIFGASAGLYGTARGQIHLRYVLEVLNVLVIPQPLVYIRNGAEAFNPDGTFKDAQTTKLLKKLIERAVNTASKLKA
jgi:chromate reductase, NAD(P)H dehydrogenase (quinone)